ncbi:MAG: bifunctional 2-polyprenyl-6-hydroxyphenol methylase/3-demethylubiquinol 3-O-methyltransferase UbiG [Pseudomonadota bacterium]|jgi:2-polyprenyl-6-hydroxyphenyl methylase/3-demethylubiquinone-9 3-methyltransferase
MTESSPTTVDPEESARFERLAALWWNADGPFWPLHRMNQLRSEWIQAEVLRHMDAHQTGETLPLSGLRILDIGCGGGILSEAVARLGATVTGIDVVERNLMIAKRHAEEGSLRIDYRCIAAENLSEEGHRFDVVLNMEVVEHVADLPLFLKSVSALVKPGGVLIVATLNRTILSYLIAIIGAEFVFGWLPKGTHQWRKFITPSELSALLKPEGLIPEASTGVGMNPLSHQFFKLPFRAVNYMTCFVKPLDCNPHP